jgi:DNA-directed RNA polymerase specialized sigma24 family protein
MPTLGSATPTTGHRLTIEWTRLRTRPDALRRATRWGLTDEPVGDLDQVLTAVGFETLGTPDAEQRLRRLVVLAADDELAGRVVVQRLLPGLLAVVRRRRRGGHGATAFDELLATLWISIRTFNPNRNPSCLAAALISDADYRAFRSANRRRSSTERPIEIDDSTPATDHTPCASDELDELLTDALAAGVPQDDIDLLRRLVDAPRAIDLADQLQVTPRTIRNRRDRITDRLREVALAA